MSLESDIIDACKELIKKSKDIVAYAGKVTQYDMTNQIVSVTVDGANTSIPCTPLDDTNIVVGRRVVILKAGGQFYLLGTLGNRVVAFPPYTGAHPSNTNPGESWYREDLGQAFMNINGVATQIAP